jgi:hypothetical protein
MPESLEKIGELVYTFRQEMMIELQIGLTEVHNRLKDPSNREPWVLNLRNLFERMPPYGVEDEDWEEEIVSRLLVLNHERYMLQSKKPGRRPRKVR